MTDTQIKGHWKLDVYAGDLRYTPLPVTRRAANMWWAIEASLPTPLRRHRVPRGLRRYRHRGRILNELVQVIEGDNLVTTSGKGVILDRLYGLASVSAMSQMGVGTSATAAAVGDTTLTGLVLKAFDALPTRASLTVTLITTYATGEGNINWQELGTFTPTPTLLNRIAPIGPFNKTTAVAIVVTQTMALA